MYDIIFLSYNEAKAEENWEHLKSRFPRAKRVHGVKGIVAAHQNAAAKCMTKWFWVVDADNVVNDDFDFDYEWPHGTNKHAVGVWRAKNNVNGLVYGYGGVKLLPRRRVLEIDPTVVDFTTSIGNDFHVMDEIASTTVVDSTEFEAWKSAFRECAKLSSAVIDRQKSGESLKRLNTWQTVANSPHADAILDGAKRGTLFGEANRGDPDVLVKLNDFDWIKYVHDTPETYQRDEDVTHLTGIELMYPEKPFVRSFRQTVAEFPDARWDDAMSRGQLESKHWLVDTLLDHLYPYGLNHWRLESAEQKKNYHQSTKMLTHVYLCASWYGVLGELLLDRFNFRGKSLIGAIRGLDIDKDATTVANRLMKHRGGGWRFKAATTDIQSLAYSDDVLRFVKYDGSVETRTETPTMVVNTSCEHIEDFAKWWDKIPDGMPVIVQSNDFFDHEEHVNCCETLEDFANQTPLSDEWYSDKRIFTKYTRFMRMGIK